MRDEIYGVSRIIRGTIVSRFDDTSLVSPLLDYFYHIPFGALLRRFESTALLSLSLSLAILNPFSSPEDDEDWIGRNVALFRWNCWGEGGTKEETLLLSRLPFCFAIWKNFLL